MDNSIAISLVKSEVENRDRQDAYYQYQQSKSFGVQNPRSDISPNQRDEVHYQNVITFLTSNVVPEGHSFATISREASSYRLIDGHLYRGLRHPKRVIIGSKEQYDIISHSHVDQKLKHKPVAIQVNEIGQEFYWKTILQDVKRFASQCTHCSQIKGESSKSKNALTQSKRIWSSLKLMVHGPYPNASGELKNILTLHDSCSKWILGKIVSTSGTSLDYELAKFVFASMCEYGFAKCELLNPQESLQKSFFKHFNQMWDELGGIDVSPADLLNPSNILDEYSQSLFEEVTAYAESNYETWETLFNVWLFQLRTSVKHSKSPFAYMFNRNPFSNNLDIPDENELCDSDEDSNQPSRKRRKLKSSTLHCRHCGETFTSKISFKIHQNRHTEDARQEGILYGEDEAAGFDVSETFDDSADLRNKKKPFQRKKSCHRESHASIEDLRDEDSDTDTNALLKDPQKIQEVTSQTVVAVKSLMQFTKDERRRRGKYIKYPADLKDEIAQFALEHGSLEASTHFSKTLGSTISESTIRNFVKAHQLFSPELKEDIGKFAYQFGVEACYRLYQDKMPEGIELQKAMVKRLKELFLVANPTLPEDDEDDEDSVKNPSRQKFVFDANLKLEIGRYAFHCGNTNAVHHFSNKLRFPMKETTVRKFKKNWMKKNGVEVLDAANRPTGDEVSYVGHLELVHGEIKTNRQMSVTSTTIEIDPQESQTAPLPLTVAKDDEENKSHLGIGNKPVKKLKRRVVTKVKPKLEKRPKRGQYANYGPALRADIAKYAMDHSNQDTVNHFREKMNIEVPESTVRGLRTQYISKKKKSKSSVEDVAELNYGRRGRPMRLGKYDSIVQKCILELVASGERPTSFMAVATAKQVLMENDPNLLVENGGSVQLNTSWAKSFLRRLNLGS